MKLLKLILTDTTLPIIMVAAPAGHMLSHGQVAMGATIVVGLLWILMANVFKD